MRRHFVSTFRAVVSWRRRHWTRLTATHHRLRRRCRLTSPSKSRLYCNGLYESQPSGCTITYNELHVVVESKFVKWVSKMSSSSHVIASQTKHWQTRHDVLPACKSCTRRVEGCCRDEIVGQLVETLLRSIKLLNYYWGLCIAVKLRTQLTGRELVRELMTSVATVLRKVPPLPACAGLGPWVLCDVPWKSLPWRPSGSVNDVPSSELSRSWEKRRRRHGLIRCCCCWREKIVTFTSKDNDVIPLDLARPAVVVLLLLFLKHTKRNMEALRKVNDLLTMRS